MTHPDFDLKALYQAMDEQRNAKGMSWSAAAREISRNLREGHPIATSTITGIKDKAVAEGDGVLQMLLWLQRTPESFVPGFEDGDTERFRLPETGKGQVLRWDARSLYAALNARRQARGMSWKEVAQEAGGVTPGMLSHLAQGGRVSFPAVMRMVGWLEQPAVLFTRVKEQRHVLSIDIDRKVSGSGQED